MNKVILSLDGGGIKGISLVMILIAIMKQLELETGKIYQPCQIFNVFAGTSTGGLLSTFIGLKRHELYKALYLYMASDPNFFRPKNAFNIVKDVAKYDSNVATDVYINFYGNQHIDKYQADINTPYTIATTLRIDKIPTETYIFKNYKSNSSISNFTDFYLYEMVRSTSAAPTFWSAYTPEINTIYNLSKNQGKFVDITPTNLVKIFDAYATKYKSIADIKNEYDKYNNPSDLNIFRQNCANAIVLVDGGLGSNNPVLLAVSEMVSLSGFNSVEFVLSIGCGNISSIDSEHYSKYRQIYKDDEISKLCIDLLDMISDALYTSYRKIYAYVKIIDKQIRTSNLQDFETIISSDNINMVPPTTVYLSKKDFTKLLVKELTSIPVNLVKNFGTYLLSMIFKMPNSNSIRKLNIVDLYRALKYNLRTFIFVCNLCTYSIYDAYKIVKTKQNQSKYLFLIYDRLNKKLKQIISNPSWKLYLDTKIIDIILTNGADTILNVKDELSNFLEENVLEPLTAGAYESTICQNMLSDKYIRLDPIYPYRVNLAESNPVNLRKMMRFTTEYITKSEPMIKKICQKLKNIKPVENVVEFNGFDTKTTYAYNIDNNINYMKHTIYDLLDVTVRDIQSYLSKKILSYVIKLYYRIYYEAYYCYIDSLINYTTNDILKDKPMNKFNLEYMKNDKLVTVSYTFDELSEILNGHIIIPQIGGDENIILHALDREEHWYELMKTINNLLRLYNIDTTHDDTHANILTNIMQSVIKLDNTNNICYGCIQDSCTTLNNKLSPSTSDIKWNSCRSLRKIINFTDDSTINYNNIIETVAKSDQLMKIYYNQLTQTMPIKSDSINSNIKITVNGNRFIIDGFNMDKIMKFRIVDTAIPSTILDLLEVSYNPNKTDYDWRNVIHCYRIANPTSKYININMYDVVDRYYILPLARVNLAFSKNIILTPFEIAYGQMLAATDFIDLHPYYVYQFADKRDVFFDKIDHRETDYRYKHTYKTSNKYYYDIKTSNKFMIAMQIAKNKLNTNVESKIYAKIIYVKHTLVQILESEIILHNDTYYAFFDKTDAIIKNSIASIQLFYGDIDTYITIYDSMKKNLMFNFN